MWTLLLSRQADAPGTFIDRRQIDGGEIRIGRDAGKCDWVLADTSGHISRVHCTMSVIGLDLFVVDTSTNGVSLNRPGQRISPQMPVAVRVNDRLLIGDYAIEVTTQAAGLAANLQQQVAAAAPSAASAFSQPDSWFDGSADPWDTGAPNADVHEFLGNAMHDFLTPPARSSAPAAMADPWGGPMSDAFSRPILASAPVVAHGDFAIPEDWAAPPAAQPPSAQPPSARPPSAGSPSPGPPAAASPFATPAADPFAGMEAFGRPADPFDGVDPFAPPPSYAAAADPFASGSSAGDPFAGMGDPFAGFDAKADPFAGFDTAPFRSDPGASPPPPSPTSDPFAPAAGPPALVADHPAVAASSPVSPAAPDAEGWAAFCAGAGIDPADLRTTPDAMHRLGVLYKQVVLGLSDLIQVRAAFKNEFRVERTQLGLGRNNPLKHLPALDSAKLLLGDPLPGFMGTDEAVRSAFEDVKKHQMAMLAGVQHALRAVFERLSPDEIQRVMQKAVGEKKGLRIGRGVNPWTVYQAVFDALRKDATSNVNSIMSVAFREGYEAFLHDAK